MIRKSSVCTSTQFALAGLFVQRHMGVFISLEVLWAPGAGSKMSVHCLDAACCSLQDRQGVLS